MFCFFHFFGASTPASRASASIHVGIVVGIVIVIVVVVVVFADVVQHWQCHEKGRQVLSDLTRQFLKKAHTVNVRLNFYGQSILFHRII